MKFARYLEDTQTPEWKKAYIDYRGLKKRITAIRKAHEGPLSDLSAESEVDEQQSERGRPALSQKSPATARIKQELNLEGSECDVTLVESSGIAKRVGEGAASESSATKVRPEKHAGPSHRSATLDERVSFSATSVPPPPAANEDRRPTTFLQSSEWDVHRENVPEGTKRPSKSSSRPIPSGSKSSYAKSIASLGRKGTALSIRHGSDRSINPMDRLTLSQLLAQLDPMEEAFFTTLDAQLEKIDAFYSAREGEMVARSKVLQEQLEELAEHKKVVKDAHPHQPSSLVAGIVSLKEVLRIRPLVVDARNKKVHLTSTSEIRNHGDETSSREGSVAPDLEHSTIDVKQKSPVHHIGLSSDPEDYLFAKKKLKKAVLEHYRALEALQNYRILNLTGFRKALKKFEKITKIQAQKQYMVEKVDKASFASNKTVQETLTEMEGLYADRFARNDRKRARKRLRAGFRFRSHHYSVFRSGILLGVSVPALASGLYASVQASTRDAIPAWEALLFLYGVVFIPVLFSLLVGINLLVWADARINYVFIFELDTRTRIDYREYYEIPSILMAALCWTFWLSFHRIGAPGILPEYWLLVWLAFCGILVLEPFPLFYRSSRYWLIRKTAKLLLSGTRRVEFADFWLGDQFCSLVFTLSNLFFFACVYARKFDENWSKCGVSGSQQWPAMFVLASLPLICRLVQSVKRYYDSRLITHLINGGKYGSGIISNLFFYIWRQRASRSHDSIFVLWILFNTIYSTYAATWDLLMDWSVLRLHAQYRFLRQDLIYTDSIPMYYFAIISNILIRFIWVLYIPHNGPSIYLRTFIGALLEVFRRWQWNFYRLENEHLGNMDQYRITREVPLPYSFDHTHVEDGDDGDEDDKALEIAVARVKEELSTTTRKRHAARRNGDED